jgi:hypothetical protein
MTVGASVCRNQSPGSSAKLTFMSSSGVNAGTIPRPAASLTASANERSPLKNPAAWR